MEQRNLKSRFTKLRGRRRATGLACPKLSRNRPSTTINMEKLVNDFNAALDETAGSSTSNITSAASIRACGRKSKSKSSLVFVSDDTNSSMDFEKIEISRDSSSLQISDSDIECARGLSLRAELVGTVRKKQTKILEYRNKKGGAENPGIESDSHTENISPVRELMGIYKKRQRKYKRMAVDPILRSVYVGRNRKSTKRKKVRSRSDTMVVRSASNKEDGVFSSKRKRSARDRSVESAVFIGTSSSSMFEEEKMDMKGLSSSSSLSSSDWEEIREGPEMDADDEQSDWPGIEPRLSGMQLSDEEEDPTICYPNQQCPIGMASGKVLKSRNTRLGNPTVLYSKFAVPNIPDSLNEVKPGDRTGADCKRQRRSTISLADTITSQ